MLREKDVAYGLVLLWSLTAVYGAQVLRNCLCACRSTLFDQCRYLPWCSC